jgi:hypothetical protein
MAILAMDLALAAARVATGTPGERGWSSHAAAHEGRLLIAAGQRQGLGRRRVDGSRARWRDVGAGRQLEEQHINSALDCIRPAAQVEGG